jgi:hypothetical protein
MTCAWLPIPARAAHLWCGHDGGGIVSKSPFDVLDMLDSRRMLLIASNPEFLGSGEAQGFKRYQEEGLAVK